VTLSYRLAVLPYADYPWCAAPRAQRPTTAALVVLAAGAAVVAVTGALTAHREEVPWSTDAMAGRRTRGGWPRRRPRGAMRVLERLSASGPSLALSAAAAGAVGWRHGAAALPVLAGAAATHVLQRALRQVVARPRPLAGRLAKRNPSFPSGHAARASAILGLLAFVGAREELAPGALTYPAAAAASLGAGLARVRRGRHWPTDVLGGLGLGAAVAAAGALWYDRLRDPPRGR
jgi:undecaprenyl-diphosphatase